MDSFRTFRRAFLFCVCAVGIWCGQSADARPRLTCKTRGVTLTANEGARVFRLGGADSYRAFVCDLRSRRTRALGTFDDGAGGGVSEFELRGDYVAFDKHVCDQEGCRSNVATVNARTGTRRASATDPRIATVVSDLVISRSGSIAWIREVEVAP